MLKKINFFIIVLLFCNNNISAMVKLQERINYVLKYDQLIPGFLYSTAHTSNLKTGAISEPFCPEKKLILFSFPRDLTLDKKNTKLNAVIDKEAKMYCQPDLLKTFLQASSDDGSLRTKLSTHLLKKMIAKTEYFNHGLGCTLKKYSDIQIDWNTKKIHIIGCNQLIAQYKHSKYELIIPISSKKELRNQEKFIRSCVELCLKIKPKNISALSCLSSTYSTLLKQYKIIQEQIQHKYPEATPEYKSLDSTVNRYASIISHITNTYFDYFSKTTVDTCPDPSSDSPLTY